MQDPTDFIQQHGKCDYLVTDVAGNPVRAEYVYLNGEVRKYPAVFYYPEY